MPWSQTPVVSRILAIAHPGLLLSDTLNRVSFHLNLPRFILMTTTIHISGLNTEPASLLPPASDSRCRVCLRIQLLTCRLNFSQVGLSRYSTGITHWVTLTNFIPTYRDSQGLGFTLARRTIGYLAWSARNQAFERGPLNFPVMRRELDPIICFLLHAHFLL